MSDLKKAEEESLNFYRKELKKPENWRVCKGCRAKYFRIGFLECEYDYYCENCALPF